jgi:hypothetical protein
VRFLFELVRAKICLFELPKTIKKVQKRKDYFQNRGRPRASPNVNPIINPSSMMFTSREEYLEFVKSKGGTERILILPSEGNGIAIVQEARLIDVWQLMAAALLSPWTEVTRETISNRLIQSIR